MIVGAEGGDRWIGGIDRQLRATVLSPFVSQKLGTFISKEKNEDLHALKALIESGKVTPVIDRTYPLDEVPDAIRYLHEGHARGKIVIGLDRAHGLTSGRLASASVTLSRAGRVVDPLSTTNRKGIDPWKTSERGRGRASPSVPGSAPPSARPSATSALASAWASPSAPLSEPACRDPARIAPPRLTCLRDREPKRAGKRFAVMSTLTVRCSRLGSSPPAPWTTLGDEEPDDDADDQPNAAPRAPTRHRVLDAALKMADTGGLESLSMRKLGHELGVEAMAIYYHFANRDEIVDGIVDLVYGEIELPVAGADWKTAMRRRAISLHDVLLHHRWAIGLMESRRNAGPRTCAITTRSSAACGRRASRWTRPRTRTRCLTPTSMASRSRR